MKNDQKFLNILYLVLSFSSIIAVIALLIFAWGFYQKVKFLPKPATLAVSAEGEVSVAPDLALLNFSVIEQDKDPQLVQERGEAKMKNILAYLKEIGLKEEDLKTLVYRLEPQYDYNWCQKEGGLPCPPKLASYQFFYQVQAKIRDFDKLGEIMAQIVKQGANEISSLEFQLENPELYQKKAREEALKKAQEKAQQIAQLSGIKLARLINISENSSPLPVKILKEEYMGGLSNRPLETGLVEIKVTVSLTYEMAY